MNDTTSTSRLAVLMVLVVGLLAGAAITPTAAVAQSQNQSTTANNTTTTPQTPTPTQPDIADSVRITPVHFDAEFLQVRTGTADTVYNTSGPFAMFTVSETVTQARIVEAPADARVMAGGRQVRIEYQKDAAPVGERSLYHLELYFEDGSSRTVKLYASNTEVNVGSANLEKYRPFIEEVLDDAEDAGYDRSPEGAKKHYEDVKDTAQLLNSLLTEQAMRLIATLFQLGLNPLAWILGVAALALGSYWMLKNKEWLLDALSNDTGKFQRMKDRLWIKYKKDQQHIAEMDLRELDAVGEMGEMYWRDAYGISTVGQLCEVARRGIPVERDGDIEYVGGVETLDAVELEDSWLRDVCDEYRLSSPDAALVHLKAALGHAATENGMGHKYRPVFDEVRRLIDERKNSRSTYHQGGDR